jgi:hypothetical protein
VFAIIGSLVWLMSCRETESDNPNRANLKVNACLKKAGYVLPSLPYQHGLAKMNCIATSSPS